VPQPKKSARPRIDAIVRHIKAGSFDEEIGQIQSAIDERNKARQDAVLKTVREVFGKKANIVIEEPDPETGEVKAEPAIARPKPRAKTAARKRPGGSPAPELPPELKAAEEEALRREKELEAEMASAAGTEPEDPEDGIVSNSPIIGSVE
jgi:hypothetical protein